MSLPSVSLAPRRSARSLVPRRDRLWFVVMVVGLAAIPLYLLLPSQLAQQWVYTLWGTGSALGIVGGVALHRPERAKAWLTIAFGLALVTGGDLLWAWFKTATGEIPFPSTADGAYLGGYVVIAVGLLALFRGRVPGGDRAGLIDATILTTGFGFLSWVFLMHPYLHDASLSPIESSIATAYPVVDVLLIGVTLRLLLAPGRRVVAFRLLIVGLTSFLIGDSIYAVLSLQGIYETGQLVDGIWLVGYVSLAAFGLHPSMRALTEPAVSAPQRLTFKRLGLLGAASLMAPAVMVIEQVRGDPIDVPVVVAGSILLFTLVLTRLADALRDLSATLFERMALEGQLKHQAQHDHLTGLANRLLFGVRLDETLAAGTPLAVLFIDLDDFKTVNDTLGHSAGDDLLVAVAGRLSASLRPEDVAARLGGDEFAVFLPGCTNEEEARAVATRILRRITEPFAIQGRSLAISPSIGVAVRTPGATNGEEMMRDADTAMYLAKAEGKAQVAVYRRDIHDRAVARLSRREQLGHAIDHDQLVLHYQPIIDLRTNRVEGLEALVRWQHPDEGLLAPAEFIPLAEETGLIGRLGEWVLRNACTEATGWPTRDDGKPLKVSVNLSAHQLRDPSIVEVIGSVLDETELAPARLVVEVTESSFVEVDSAAERLAAVGALGVHVAIDDFGTGYSSLSYLAQLPVDAVKVDRSFTNMVGATGREGQVARLVMQLASAVDLEAIVEGIETAEQLAEVRRLGCRFGQGFFIARPMPAADVRPFLAKSESDRAASRLGADAAA